MEEAKYQVRKLFENVFTFEEGVRVRSFLLIGREKAAMIDSGNGLVDFETELPKLTDLPIILINTHGDADHIARNELFDTRYICEKDIEKVKAKRPFESETYLFVKDGDTIDLGGVVLKVLECPGHTPGSILLYDEADRWLFGGDTLTSVNTFMFGVSTDREQMLTSFRALIAKDLDVDVLFTCHDGCPIFNYKDLLRDTCGALEDYLSGKPETDIYHLTRGAHDKFLKRYIRGCASILPEVVEAAV